MKTNLHLFLAGVCATFAAVSAADAQFVFQPATEAASKDTKIYVSVPTGNFSSNLSVVSQDVGAHFLALVQFDLSAYPFPPAEITSAILTLYASGLGVSGGPAVGGTVTISPILNDWRENAADPGAAPLATYDAFFGTTPTIGVGSSVASQNIAGAGFVNWDITALAAAWADGSQANYGVLIQLSTGGGDVGFADTDSHPGVAGSAPKLSVVPEPSAAALLGGTGLIALFRRRRSSRTA